MNPGPLPSNPTQDVNHVALVVVHGIGQQEPGETIEKLAKGLELTAQETAEESGVRLWIRRDPKGHLESFGTPTRKVKVYEAYWADVLEGSDYGTFRVPSLNHLAWYPIFHYWREGDGRRLTLVGAKSVALTAGLSLVTALIEFGHWGITEPLRFYEAIRWGRRASIAKSDGKIGFPRWNSKAEDYERQGLIPRRNWVRRILDATAGDIFAYVESALALQFGRGRASEVAAEIVGRLRDAMDEAQNARGVEEIHILAHSLGTVVAFHFLAGVRGIEASGASWIGPVVGLHTIGSPLEKIRLFWRPLGDIASLSRAERPGLEWCNFSNPLDPVSSRLNHFDVWGRVANPLILEGGLISSHTVYEQNRKFLAHLTERLLGERLAPKRNMIRSVAGIYCALKEALILLGGIALLIGLGLVMLGITIFLSLAGSWLFGALLKFAGWENLGARFQHSLLWITAGAVILSALGTRFIQIPMMAYRRFQQTFPKPSEGRSAVP